MTLADLVGELNRNNIDDTSYYFPGYGRGIGPMVYYIRPPEDPKWKLYDKDLRRDTPLGYLEQPKNDRWEVFLTERDRAIEYYLCDSEDAACCKFLEIFPMQYYIENSDR